MKLSPIIVTCGEQEIFTLLDSVEISLFNNPHIYDQLYILVDSNKVTEDFVFKVKESIRDIRFKIVESKFEKDFSEFRNSIYNHIPLGNVVIWLDADENIHDDMFLLLYSLFEQNKDLEVVFLARANYVKGITQEHINKWRWVIDNYGRINYPDFQGRVHIHNGIIKWEGKVHERLSNYTRYAQFTHEGVTLLHIKDIERQEKQNKFYDTLCL